MTMIIAVQKGNFCALINDTCMTVNEGYKKKAYKYGNSKIYTTGLAFHTFTGSVCLGNQLVECLINTKSTNQDIITEELLGVRKRLVNRFYEWINSSKTSLCSIFLYIRQREPQFIAKPILIVNSYEKNNPTLFLNDGVHFSIPSGVKPEWLDAPGNMFRRGLFEDERANSNFELFKGMVITGAAGIYRGISPLIPSVSNDFYYAISYSTNTTIKYIVGYAKNEPDNIGIMQYEYDLSHVPYEGIITKEIIEQNMNL